MGMYKLEETPNSFIGPYYQDNKFVYRMVNFSDASNWQVIRDIDLRKDKLMIHGTEIKEATLQKLYDALRLKSNEGKMYVNSNGACYIVVTNNGIYRPIDNVIFDWSNLGVIVPNSTNDTSRKQIQEKEQEMMAMSSLVSSLKGEASTSKTSLEATKKELEEAKEELSSCEKGKEEMEKELQMVKRQVSTKEIEFEAKRIEFESYNEDMKAKLHDMEQQHSLDKVELQSLKTQLQLSNQNVKKLECELSSCREENNDIVNELQQSIKVLLVFAQKEVQELEDQSFGKSCVTKLIQIVSDE